MSILRILVVDNHAIVRQGIRGLLDDQAGLSVVGEGVDGHDALRMTRDLRPDVVIMDIQLPNLNGIDACRQIVKEFPKTKVIALSIHSEHQLVKQSYQAGVSGYLLKECDIDDLVQAIEEVVAGNVYLYPKLAGGIMEDYIHPSANAFSPVTLTAREREILQPISEGQSTKEIAQKLQLSVKTVEAHRHNIMQKLDMHSVAELTKYAIKVGLTYL